MLKTICNFISQYLGVIVLIVAVLAFLFPWMFSAIPTTAINYLLGVVMFGMGLMLNLNDFKVVFSRPKDHRMPRSVHGHALARLGTCPGVQP